MPDLLVPRSLRSIDDVVINRHDRLPSPHNLHSLKELLAGSFPVSNRSHAILGPGLTNSLAACLWSIAVGSEFRRVPHRHCCAATIPVLLTIRAVGKWLFGDQSKESLIEVPEGQLYLVRPLSVKGYSELIYKDARAAIRRTSTEFQYQLVVTRAYEEGEEELLADQEDESGEADHLDKDEQAFLLDESLQFRVDIRETDEKVFAWRDLSDSPGDLWEFVCDRSTKPETVEAFEVVALRCQYERKYKKSAENATEEDLQQFVFDNGPIPSASPVLGPSKSRSPTISPSPSSSRVLQPPTQEHQHQGTMVKASSSKAAGAAQAAAAVKRTEAPVSAKHPEGRETLVREVAELHLFDLESGTFIMQDQIVEAVVLELGNWNFWLKVTGNERSWLGRSIEDDLNPVFNFEYLSAIFNVYEEDHSAYSWLLRFQNQPQLERFQQSVMQALWEHNNKMKWLKAKDTDRDYVLEAFRDLTMEDADPVEEEEDEDEEEEEEEDAGIRSEEYDEDEDEDEVVTRPMDDNVNSQLAVGYKHDRSFVVRGSKIGVFKHTPDNHLEFATNISKVQTPKGKLFNPKKVMLHASDQNMILQNPDNPNSVYRMDLEVGKVVDEWKVHDDISINNFAPEDVSDSYLEELA